MSNVDEIRNRSYLTQMEREQDAKVKEKTDEHREKLARVISTHEETTQGLRKDYEVKISDEAEALDRKLGLIRERNQVIITQEREAGERETDKLHQQYAQRLEQEKKTGDEQITRLQSYYKKAGEELHKQYEKERSRTVQKGKNA